MPVMFGHDSDGCYAKFGTTGTKYYYKCGNDSSRREALKKVDQQRKAIEANKNK